MERSCLNCSPHRPTPLCNFGPFLPYLDKLLKLKCYFVGAPSVLLLLADDGCSVQWPFPSGGWCGGRRRLVWVLVVTRAVWLWCMETERPPANWATCDIVWCCAMLCHKHTTFCHLMSRSTSPHLDTTPAHRRSGPHHSCCYHGQIFNFTDLKLIPTGQHESYLSFANLRPNLNIYSELCWQLGVQWSVQVSRQ